MGGLVSAVFGSGQSTSNTTVSTPGPSPEELDLIKLNTELGKKQLENVNNLQPLQQQFLDLSLADLKRQAAQGQAFDQAVPADQQAAFYKQEFERAQKLGPMQDELLKMQLDQLRTGGAATPEQRARIKEATDAAIAAGNTDIDANTQRGIGLISDELANSRGLRLSDAPIGSEAALLAREGVIQKGSLEKNLRSGEASSVLNYPLAVQQVTSGINQNQQNIASAAANFQAQLRQQAQQNRMSLFGQTSGTGIGLASAGGGAASSALSSLSGVRSANRTQVGSAYDPSAALAGYGKAASGIGAILSAFPT